MIGHEPQRVQATFRGHRVFIRGSTVTGSELTFLADTGGGAPIISPAAAARVGLAVAPREVDGELFARVTDCPLLKPLPGMPQVGEPLLVAELPAYVDGADGILGQAWHAGRVWTFDYLSGEVWVGDGTGAASGRSEHAVALGFQQSADGTRTNAFPRIEAAVDGETWSFLLDTGATLGVTAATRRLLGDALPLFRGTSFAVESLIRRWQERHPEWRCFPAADIVLGGSVIEVPSVTIAGYEVGPVLFTSRPDRNFHEFMGQWMDRRIEGALGGSLFRYFRLVIDYPRAEAHLHR
jgi:hypothetical protein